jgi:hypothetical protein
MVCSSKNVSFGVQKRIITDLYGEMYVVARQKEAHTLVCSILRNG